MSQGTSLALMGLGLSGEQAALIGADPSICVGKGTSQTGAAVMLTDNVELNVSSGQTAGKRRSLLRKLSLICVFLITK